MPLIAATCDDPEPAR